MDAVRIIVESLGVDYKDFMAKFENDPVTKVIMDNKSYFYPDKTYHKLLGWFFVSFKPMVDLYPGFMGRFKDKDKYLTQLLILFIPYVHVKFFESSIQEATPREILSLALREIDSVDMELLKKQGTKEMEFVW